VCGGLREVSRHFFRRILCTSSDATPVEHRYSYLLANKWHLLINRPVPTLPHSLCPCLSLSLSISVPTVPLPLPRFCHHLAGSADSISQSKSEAVLIRLQDVVADSSTDGRPFLSLCSLIDHQLTGIITKEVSTCAVLYVIAL
jgi:hypothetical protein